MMNQTCQKTFTTVGSNLQLKFHSLYAYKFVFIQ